MFTIVSCHSSSGGSGHIADRLRQCRRGQKNKINSPTFKAKQKGVQSVTEDDVDDSEKLVCFVSQIVTYTFSCLILDI